MLWIMIIIEFHNFNFNLEIINLLGVQPCLRRLFPEFEALFLKSDYLFMIQSTVRR